MATKYSDYDYKSDANAVLNAKIGWNLATTDEERQKQNQIANSARDRLKAYGYSDLADQISAGGADATQTRQIIENYSKPKTTAPVETNNLKSTEVNRENAGVFDKYNNFWDESVNVDPFETSYGKAIMGKYDLAALQGRDNAVASGGASNGGNIDSYAAANAMRQQASLISQGQSAVLDAYQKRIDSARGYLSDMGVNIDRVFNQDETAKNNDVARKSEIASVTGYVPNEWTYENNQYLNKDGTVKDIYLTDEFDNSGGFETIINDAKAKLATTTDATERANLEATIYYAQQAKNIKTEQNPTKYGKYASSVRAVSPLKTATVLKDERDNDTVLKSLGIESADKRYEIDANNQNKLDVVGAETQGQKEILELNDKLGNNISEEQLKTQTDTTISNWLYSPYKDVSGSTEIWKEGYETKKPQYIAAEKISDPDILASIKESLTKAGWDADKKIKEYKRNIAIEIAKIEGKDYNNDDVLKSIYERPEYKWVWDGKDS